MKNDEELRKEFQISMLFRKALLGGDGKGAFVQDTRNRYKDSEVELLFLGYKVAREDDAGQLRRYAPERNIAIGHMTEMNKAMNGAGLPQVSPEQIRLVLKIVGGWPS